MTRENDFFKDFFKRISRRCLLCLLMLIESKMLKVFVTLLYIIDYLAKMHFFPRLKLHKRTLQFRQRKEQPNLVHNNENKGMTFQSIDDFICPQQ